MPITNDVLTCINHPHQRLLRNDRPVVLHPVELGDVGLTVIRHRAMFLASYVCMKCGYVELYAVEKEELANTWNAAG